MNSISRTLGHLRLALIVVLSLFVVAEVSGLAEILRPTTSAAGVSAGQVRGGRGGRIGGVRGSGHRMNRSFNRGTFRTYNRGSFRSYSRGSIGGYRMYRTNAGRRASRSAGLVRPSGVTRESARQNIASRHQRVERSSHAGSLKNRANTSRSLSERRAALPNEGQRSLSDIGDRIPPEMRDRWEEGRERRQERREQRREELSDRARWYPAYGYWWDYGYWWHQYYDDDGVVYIQVYPDDGTTIETLPDEASRVDEIAEGEVYELNGVFYKRTPAGDFAVISPPGGSDPDPITIVQRACEAIAELDAFTLLVTDTMDHVQTDGRKIRGHTTRTVNVQRPDRLAASTTGDGVNRSFWYDGRSVTLLDTRTRVFATTAAPRTLDAALDFTVAELSVNLPLVDFLYSDPFETLQGAMTNGDYLGMLDVDGTPCHHVSFSTPDADWQLWIRADDPEVPTRLAITYTTVPEQPTYMARFESWTPESGFPASTFASSVPEGIEQIPFSTPKASLDRVLADQQRFREENQRVADYIAAQRTITLFSGIAHTPEAAARIAAEEKRLAEIGEVSQAEIDAYEAAKQEMDRTVRAARRAARSG